MLCVLIGIASTIRSGRDMLIYSALQGFKLTNYQTYLYVFQTAVSSYKVQS